MITNIVYDENQMGMKSLPDVADDRKNMKHTITNMLNIPLENIFEIEDGKLDKLD